MCCVETHRANACVEDRGGGKGKELTRPLGSARNLEFFVATCGVLTLKMLQMGPQPCGNLRSSCRPERDSSCTFPLPSLWYPAHRPLFNPGMICPLTSKE